MSRAAVDTTRTRLRLDAVADEDEPGSDFEIILGPTQIGGVWANSFAITRSSHEFTLDFVRLDFARRTGVIVARVAASPLLVGRLLEALTNEWQEYQRG